MEIAIAIAIADKLERIGNHVHRIMNKQLASSIYFKSTVA